MRLLDSVKDVDQNITDPSDMLVFATDFLISILKVDIIFSRQDTFIMFKIDAPEKSDIL